MIIKDKEVFPNDQNSFSSGLPDLGVYRELEATKAEHIVDYTEGCHGIDPVDPSKLFTGWIEVDEDTLETLCPLHECDRGVNISQILGDLVVGCEGSCAFGLPIAVPVEEGMIIDPDQIDELRENLFYT